MPLPRLHGKVAIVTGAAMGLGEAIARRFGNGAVDGKIQAHVVSIQA